MTHPTPELPTMKRAMSALINDWGVSCTIKRRDQTKRNAMGAVSAPFSTIGTETLWIQPYSAKNSRGSQMMEFGILDKTTHMAFERYSGTSVQNQDQISATGDTYAYDVLSAQITSTHRVIFLQQVKRSV